MPSERTEVAVAAIGSRIFVAGGFGGGRALEIYDVDADRWRRAAALPRTLHHASAAAVEGRLYVVGGYVDGWQPVASVYEYDPANDNTAKRLLITGKYCPFLYHIELIPKGARN